MLTQEEIDKLRETYGEIWHVKGKAKTVPSLVAGQPPTEQPAWEIVFKKPQRKDYKFFKANLANPAKKHEAQEILLRSCIVVPELKNFDALLDKFPGIPECPAVDSALEESLGLSGDEAEKQ